MAAVSTCFTVKPSAATRYSKLHPSLLRLKPSQCHPLSPSRSHQTNDRNPLKFRPSRSGRVILSVVGATNDLRPGGIMESDKLPHNVRNRTMDAVDACGGRVTTGDISRTTGIKLSEAEKALQALAADSNGFLEVSDEGDVVFVFPKDYRENLAAKSCRRDKIQPLVEEVMSAAEYMVMISVGASLVASIVLVFATIVSIVD